MVCITSPSYSSPIFLSSIIVTVVPKQKKMTRRFRPNSLNLYLTSLPSETRSPSLVVLPRNLCVSVSTLFPLILLSSFMSSDPPDQTTGQGRGPWLQVREPDPATGPLLMSTSLEFIDHHKDYHTGD